jgi:hypothetical protein
MAVTDDTGIATSAITATAHLTLLAEHLRELGLLSRIHVASRRLPELVVVNPDAFALAEIIYALPEKGAWCSPMRVRTAIDNPDRPGNVSTSDGRVTSWSSG